MDGIGLLLRWIGKSLAVDRRWVSVGSLVAVGIIVPTARAEASGSSAVKGLERKKLLGVVGRMSSPVLEVTPTSAARMEEMGLAGDGYHCRTKMGKMKLLVALPSPDLEGRRTAMLEVTPTMAARMEEMGLAGDGYHCRTKMGKMKLLVALPSPDLERRRTAMLDLPWRRRSSAVELREDDDGAPY
ncbi:hypothetical protein ACLOJK_018031 [Asimina triloba]